MSGANPPTGAAQIPARKGRWATRARQRITIISKGAGEIFAALAEPLMRYATIYLALATSIPALNWGPLYATALGIVIIAPEFVLLGALSIAEQAIKSGQTKWGRALYIVSFLLAAIMIATFVDIFIYTFPDLALKVLNFARCLVAVSFSLVLGKLDKESDEADVVHVAQPSTDAVEHTLDQLKADLSRHIEQGLQQIRVEVRTHRHITEEDTTSPQSLLLSAGNRTADRIKAANEGTADTTFVGQVSAPERAISTPTRGHESERTPDNEPERGADKLALTLDFLRENPQRASSPEIDTLLATHLGLKRPASARFWRLKAQELLGAEASNSKSNDQGAFARVLAYVQTHEPTTQKAVAVHLGITERTVRRHFAALRKSGQLPLTWTHVEEDNEQSVGQDVMAQSIGQPTLESNPSDKRTANNGEEQDSENVDNVVLFRHAAR